MVDNKSISKEYFLSNIVAIENKKALLLHSFLMNLRRKSSQVSAIPKSLKDQKTPQNISYHLRKNSFQSNTMQFILACLGHLIIASSLPPLFITTVLFQEAVYDVR